MEESKIREMNLFKARGAVPPKCKQRTKVLLLSNADQTCRRAHGTTRSRHLLTLIIDDVCDVLQVSTADNCGNSAKYIGLVYKNPKASR